MLKKYVAGRPLKYSAESMAGCDTNTPAPGSALSFFSGLPAFFVFQPAVTRPVRVGTMEDFFRKGGIQGEQEIKTQPDRGAARRRTPALPLRQPRGASKRGWPLQDAPAGCDGLCLLPVPGVRFLCDGAPRHLGAHGEPGRAETAAAALCRASGVQQTVSVRTHEQAGRLPVAGHDRTGAHGPRPYRASGRVLLSGGHRREPETAPGAAGAAKQIERGSRRCTICCRRLRRSSG